MHLCVTVVSHNEIHLRHRSSLCVTVVSHNEIHLRHWSTLCVTVVSHNKTHITIYMYIHPVASLCDCSVFCCVLQTTSCCISVCLYKMCSRKCWLCKYRVSLHIFTVPLRMYLLCMHLLCTCCLVVYVYGFFAYVCVVYVLSRCVCWHFLFVCLGFVFIGWVCIGSHCERIQLVHTTR